MELTERTRRQGKNPLLRTSGAVVVTGASSGIGRACALKLANSSFHVFAGVRKEEDAQALVEASTGRLTPLFIDVTDADLVSAAASVVEEAAGGGVGSLLVQLAKRVGATVIAAAGSERKLALARSLGRMRP
jgi:NAD(P)-dependent dehydrogenase (short-subunit alcohol dehydrogenase family)